MLIVEFLNQIRDRRATAKDQRLPVDPQYYDLAEYHALKAQERLSSDEKRKALSNFFTAKAVFELAERSAKD